MKYVQLGNSEINVSQLCVGCMSFGRPSEDFHQWTLNPQETETIIRKALDLGINFFDTANVYSHGTSEEYLGQALKKNIARDKAVIATKVYFNEGHLSKEAINSEIDSSLKRLGTDYVDLYIIHRFDYDTSIEETMEALDGLVKSGKVRALGLLRCTVISFIICSLPLRKTAGQNLFPCRIIIICCTVRTNVK